MEKKDTGLPIYAYKEKICDSVANNSFTIITAETGAGKSTCVPVFVEEMGYNVVVTQPRRLAARSLADRVAELNGCVLGEEVGYRTGFERLDSEKTKILFCTDGLQLVREITGNNPDVLIIDEVHEWNINIETLVAWVKKQHQDGWPVKVVIMSATMEAEKLADYYGRDNVSIISVPGREYLVVSKTPFNDPIYTIKSLIERNRNVLVFCPGKSEIEKVMDELRNSGATILPLHAALTVEDQKKCFYKYNTPKVIVATNIAQTSITIPDIDAVVDFGTEKRIELHDGVEGLYLNYISQADCDQRKGRAGRTKEGEYYLFGLSYENREKVSEPDICRHRLDQTILRLACVGVDVRELNFFHPINKEAVVEARETLYAIGALDDHGNVTSIGHDMSKLPVGIQQARMIVEAYKLDVVDPIIDIAAIFEVGGIKDTRFDYWREHTTEEESDLLCELELFRFASKQNKDDFEFIGVSKKKFFKALELRDKIREGLKLSKDCGDGYDRKKVLKACITGMVNHVYKYDRPEYENGDMFGRILDKKTCIPNDPEFIVGKPFNLETKRGILHLITMATAVNISQIESIAPHLFYTKLEDVSYDSILDLCTQIEKRYVNKCIVDMDIVKSFDEEKNQRVFTEWLHKQLENLYPYTCNNQLNEVILSNSKKKEIFDRVKSKCKSLLKKIPSYEEWIETSIDLKGKTALSQLTEQDIDSLRYPGVPEHVAQKILKGYPDFITIHGEELKVNYESYGHDNPFVHITKDFVLKYKTGSHRFPNGEKLLFNCPGYYSKENLQDLYKIISEEKFQEESSKKWHLSSMLYLEDEIFQSIGMESNGKYMGIKYTGIDVFTHIYDDPRRAVFESVDALYNIFFDFSFPDEAMETKYLNDKIEITGILRNSETLRKVFKKAIQNSKITRIIGNPNMYKRMIHGANPVFKKAINKANNSCRLNTNQKAEAIISSLDMAEMKKALGII